MWLYPVKKPGRGTSIGGISAKQAMRTHLPEIPGTADRIGGNLRRDLFARIGLRVVKKCVQLPPIKPEFTKVDPELGKVGKFKCQQVSIPTSVLGKLVVGQNIGPFLRGIEMRQRDDRNMGQSKLLRCQNTAMPGNDAILAINQYRVVEAKLPDGPGDPRDLRLRVRAGIPCVGDQGCNRAELD